MFGKKTVVDMINRSTDNQADRRTFLRAAGLAGVGAVGTTALLGSTGLTASAAPEDDVATDKAVLNFALNLEYLEAEFYRRAYYGWGLATGSIDGKGETGKVTGGHAVKFKSNSVKQYAREIAGDETNHVLFLRDVLGGDKVARPAIDLKTSFTAAARFAGLIKSNQTFDPFANENNFLLAAFIFEDVGVTAYKGASPLITNKTYLEAAAGILAVEAYHAGIIRSALYNKGLIAEVKKISDARDKLDGKTDDDQGLNTKASANIVPTDNNGIVYSRDAADVLNIVYLTPAKVTKGGFFPAGVNGGINESNNNA